MSKPVVIVLTALLFAFSIALLLGSIPMQETRVPAWVVLVACLAMLLSVRKR